MAPKDLKEKRQEEDSFTTQQARNRHLRKENDGYLRKETKTRQNNIAKIKLCIVKANETKN